MLLAQGIAAIASGNLLLGGSWLLGYGAALSAVEVINRTSTGASTRQATQGFMRPVVIKMLDSIRVSADKSDLVFGGADNAAAQARSVKANDLDPVVQQVANVDRLLMKFLAVLACAPFALLVLGGAGLASVALTTITLAPIAAAMGVVSYRIHKHGRRVVDEALEADRAIFDTIDDLEQGLHARNAERDVRDKAEHLSEAHRVRMLFGADNSTLISASMVLAIALPTTALLTGVIHTPILAATVAGIISLVKTVGDPLKNVFPLLSQRERGLRSLETSRGLQQIGLQRRFQRTQGPDDLAFDAIAVLDSPTPGKEGLSFLLTPGITVLAEDLSSKAIRTIGWEITLNGSRAFLLHDNAGKPLPGQLPSEKFLLIENHRLDEKLQMLVEKTDRDSPRLVVVRFSEPVSDRQLLLIERAARQSRVLVMTNDTKAILTWDSETCMFTSMRVSESGHLQKVDDTVVRIPRPRLLGHLSPLLASSMIRNGGDASSLASFLTAMTTHDTGNTKRGQIIELHQEVERVLNAVGFLPDVGMLPDRTQLIEELSRTITSVVDDWPRPRGVNNAAFTYEHIAPRVWAALELPYTVPVHGVEDHITTIADTYQALRQLDLDHRGCKTGPSEGLFCTRDV